MKTVTRKRLVEEWARERDCFWCDRPFAYRGKHAPTLEHFIPRSRGGTDAQGNAVVAHRSCNHRRGNRLPTEAEMRRFVQFKGSAGIQVLRVFAESIERTLADRSSASISGRSS